MEYLFQKTGTGFIITAKLSCPVGQARCLAVTAASWVCEAVGDTASILWPNHVVLGEKRVCAITCRATKDNVIMLIFAPASEASDMLPADFAERVSASAERDLSDYPDNRAELIQTFCSRCRTVMKFVNVNYRGMPVHGFAFAVDKHGGLMVMTQRSRTVITLYGGEAKIVEQGDVPEEIPDLPTMPRI